MSECPKKRTSYILYGCHVRQNRKEELDGLDQKEKMSKIAEWWREATDDEKSVFIEKANEEKEAYEAYVEKYGKPERKKKKKNASKSKASGSCSDEENSDVVSTDGENGEPTFEDLDRNLKMAMRILQKTRRMVASAAGE